MSNERKRWSMKDNDFVWDNFQAGWTNEAIADAIGRTPIAVGVRISNLKARYGYPKAGLNLTSPATARAPRAKPSKEALVTPALVRVLLVSCIGAAAGLMIGTAILHFYGQEIIYEPCI